ncbi:MAG TPA: MOSC and FAD-binding oxidoreductase domain-containing protein [Streptosporangiaceae bacterium]|nr:MOSC and FAD-binding oxidoreductase domain-containing protein [Streptosporangiaceae bacterium]
MSSGRAAGSLVSVNVGLPQDISWHGRTVHTGVWKRPVQGPSQVRRLNIDGDGQGDLAGHGGVNRAVFVYQLGSYEYWQRELGRSDFEYGQFGENFTVSGLPDDEVRVGDRFQVGEAIFEVSQPRVTCYRVGIRMNDPRMPALLVSHHRPGFYFRVLREGAVRPGDPIVKVAAGPEATGPEAMTVAEVDGLLYLPGHPRERVEAALRIPALSEGWQASFREIVQQAERRGADSAGATGNAGLTAQAPPPAWPGFRDLAVAEITQESTSVVSLRLADPAGSDLPDALPGQFLTLRLHPGYGQPPVLRSYSMSGASGIGTYRISVKREPHGTASQFVHDHVGVGDQFEVAAPRGTFVLEPGAAPVLLISAGVGATPVLAMLHALASAGSSREIWWLHGARSKAEEAFAAEAQTLLAGLAGGHRYVCFSSPGPSDAPGRDFDATGHLTADVLAALDLPASAQAYICGPAGFMTGISEALSRLGLGPSQIKTEIFGTHPNGTPGIAAAAAVPPHQPSGPSGDGPEIAFARSGITTRWSTGYGSLLELAEACDVPVRWSCRTGVCHTCETPLLSGAVRYSPEPVDEPGAGSTLICCAAPSRDVVLDL